MRHIRNFCIVAHVDHGKSTLADAILKYTKTIDPLKMQAQLLDDMDLERERGITIKSHPIQMQYQYKGAGYVLHLIDTPGHVDFSYEVSRAIAACEGALLVVDASQGVEAQTIANMYLALEQDLAIIPVLNKVDLPHARPDEVTDELVNLLGCLPEEVLRVSAKEGEGIEQLMAQIIEQIPPPKGDPNQPLKAMVFDAVYSSYRGVEIYARLMDGRIKKGMPITFLQGEKNYKVEEVGIFKMAHVPTDQLSAGDVGYITANIKQAHDVKIGATLTSADTPCKEPVRGFSDVKPMLFAGIYPVRTEDYGLLKPALEKLQLNDASLVWEPESSEALGFGFRCGFLGLLHMEIIQERLTREFHMDVLTTVPSVPFKLIKKDGSEQWIHAPSQMPLSHQFEKIEEPIMVVQIITESNYVGPIMELCMKRRGHLINQVYLTIERVELTFEMPLVEIIFDFFDRLKTLSKGYASLDYRLKSYESSDLVRVDILLNGTAVDALSAIIHRSKAQTHGRTICKKLKKTLPRHLFEVPIQAAIGAKVVARETVKAKRKDVTAKCYGGDITRRKKLLEKQKAGKKRMRQVAQVNIPQEAFLTVLKWNDEEGK